MTVNRTSAAVGRKSVYLVVSRDWRAIQAKYRRMEEDLRSIANICQGKEGLAGKVANFAAEAVAFDPLS